MKNMIKNIIALVLVLALCASCAALGENTDSVFSELNWSDLESEINASGMEARFVTFDEVAVKIWMPNVYQSVEIPEEQREEGIIGMFTYDLEEVESGVMVMLFPTNFQNVVDYAEFVLDQGGTNLDFAFINGLPAVSYSMPGKDVMYLAMVTSQQQVLEFSFWPISDENTLALYQVMLFSIQSAE